MAGEPPSSGGSSRGGAGGGGGLPSNCWGDWIGVCCSHPEECVDPGTAWGMVVGEGGGGPGGGAGEAGAAGANDPLGCPSAYDLPEGLCYGYESGRHHDGLCCYSYWSGSCCGRPFVVGGEARVALVAQRDDWGGARDAADRALDEPTRAELARQWLADALLEHASVASFARFVLDLLAVGAPSELVERAQSAIGDEIAHARACFALAARYAGEPLGPAALPTSEPGRSVRLEELAAAAVREGCVGETLAALQAEAQLGVVSDVRARAALELIARDEASHAELSWAFVRFAIERGGDPVKRAVREAFLDAERTLELGASAELPAVDLAVLAAHGRLTPAERAACHRAAFRDVIRPCRHALLGESQRSAQATPGTGMLCC